MDRTFSFDGINVSGMLTCTNGHSELTRGYIAVLRALQIPLALHDFSYADAYPLNNSGLWDIASRNPYAINLACTNLNYAPKFVTEAGSQYFSRKYNIAAWAWEAPELPKHWLPLINVFDEIWVASNFEQECFERSGPIPVYKIEPVIDFECPKASNKESFGLSSDEFTFLFVFDCRSMLGRKNPLGLIQAFKKCFVKSEKARLVLKCLYVESIGAEFNLIRTAIEDAKITLLENEMTREQVLGLMAACDCYVSLHTAEGFGLTLAECMAMGKPVIATGWSGNMDFMTPANSYPVSYRLKQVPDPYGPFEYGMTYAEADLDDAARLMREVFDNLSFAQKKGEQAAINMKERYSLKAVSAKMQARLIEIQKSLIEPAPGSHGLLSDSELRKARALLQFHCDTRKNWSSRTRPILNRFTPYRILKWLLRPMLDQQTYYLQTNSRVIEHLLTEIEELKTELQLQKTRKDDIH